VLARMTGALLASAFVAALFAAASAAMSNPSLDRRAQRCLSTFWWVLCDYAYAATSAATRVASIAACSVCLRWR
jgi:hypothetical protein